MRKTTLSSLAVIVLGASLFTYNIAEQIADAKYKPDVDYYAKYKKYKKKYKELKKDYKELKKDYKDLGMENESHYLDLVQCQRVINGDNPWEEAINSK
jgi:peptidoglycan hydrolase CwlO-like protein